MATEITFFGQSAFSIVTPGGQRFLIDPWLENPANPEGMAVTEQWERVDGIFLTHAHGDHLGNTAQLVKRFDCPVYCHFDLAEALIAYHKYDAETVGFPYRINPGGSVAVGEAGFLHAIPAAHGSALMTEDANGARPVEGGASMAFVFEINDGPSFLHTGDTALTADFHLASEFFMVDVMAVCIGDTFTMGPASAATMTQWFNPKTVIPMHYGTFPVLTGTPEAFAEELSEIEFEGEVKIAAVGKALNF
jgi:L-ascorbate metabolism protein UlaG (beta-lactamase superfamily)